MSRTSGTTAKHNPSAIQLSSQWHEHLEQQPNTIQSTTCTSSHLKPRHLALELSPWFPRTRAQARMKNLKWRSVHACRSCRAAGVGGSYTNCVPSCARLYTCCVRNVHVCCVSQNATMLLVGPGHASPVLPVRGGQPSLRRC